MYLSNSMKFGRQYDRDLSRWTLEQTDSSSSLNKNYQESTAHYVCVTVLSDDKIE